MKSYHGMKIMFLKFIGETVRLLGFRVECTEMRERAREQEKGAYIYLEREDIYVIRCNLTLNCTARGETARSSISIGTNFLLSPGQLSFLYSLITYYSWIKTPFCRQAYFHLTMTFFVRLFSCAPYGSG